MTSDHWGIAAVQVVLTYAMPRGLLVAALVEWLVPAAVINAAIHFGLCLLALRFLPRWKKNAVHD
jgi:hypothetical protein